VPGATCDGEDIPASRARHTRQPARLFNRLPDLFFVNRILPV